MERDIENFRKLKSHRFSIFVFCVLVGNIIGCSSQTKPQVDSAAEYLLDAQELIATGDHEAALEKLNSSIEMSPDAWTYFERAQLLAKMGKDAEAKSDINAGLGIDPNNSKLKWLQKEIKKPKPSRFKKEIPLGKSE